MATLVAGAAGFSMKVFKLLPSSLAGIGQAADIGERGIDIDELDRRVALLSGGLRCRAR